MADAKLRVNILGDASDLSRSLAIASKRLESFGKRAKEVGKDLSLRLTLPIGAAAGAAIKMASDMEESTNKVRVAFGQSSKEVEAFAKTSLRSFGIAESSALDMSALFGDMATGMGVSRGEAAELSTALVGLAGDLASFKNINIEEVTTALSGVFTGETESLKRLGIVMTETNLAQFALDQGIQKNIKSMSQQEKIMLRLQYIFSVTKNAQGDFARTSEGAANQMRIFQESLKEVGAELGSVMLPVFTKAITKVNDLLKEFRELDKGTQESIVKFGLLVAAAPPIIFAVGQIATAFSALGTVITTLTSAAFLPNLLAMLSRSALIAAKLAPLLLMGDTRPEDQDAVDIMIAANKAVEAEDQFAQSADGMLQSANETAKAVDKMLKIGSFAPTKPAPFKLPFTAEDLELDALTFAAQQTAAELDEMLRLDPTLQFALASESAAIETFGNAVKATGETIIEPMEKIKETVLGLSESAFNFFMQIASSLQGAFQQILSGENVFESIGKAVLNLIKQLIAAAAAAAVVGAIISAITGVPFNKTFKATFAATSGIPAFANGGIVSGPTMGLMGEYMGARSNPEVIAPLDRLQSIMGGRNQNVNVTGQFRIDGQDLVVAVERANNERSNLIG